MEEQLELFPELVKKSALDTARDIIYGDREKTYGDPSKNLNAIARMWSAYLATRLGVDVDLDYRDVCWMMTQLKSCRAANDLSHDDNLIDGIGYLALLDRCNSAA